MTQKYACRTVKASNVNRINYTYRSVRGTCASSESTKGISFDQEAWADMQHVHIKRPGRKEEGIPACLGTYF
jgi:hypothetical protein